MLKGMKMHKHKFMKRDKTDFDEVGPSLLQKKIKTVKITIIKDRATLKSR